MYFVMTSENSTYHALCDLMPSCVRPTRLPLIVCHIAEEGMAKKAKIKKPIMTPDEERFMASEGLLQWTQAVITKSERVAAALAQQRLDLISRDPMIRRKAILNL